VAVLDYVSFRSKKERASFLAWMTLILSVVAVLVFFFRPSIVFRVFDLVVDHNKNAEAAFALFVLGPVLVTAVPAGFWCIQRYFHPEEGGKKLIWLSAGVCFAYGVFAIGRILYFFLFTHPSW